MNTNHTVNLLRCVPCTSLTWWRNVDVTEIMPFTMHVTLSTCCRERRQEFIPPQMWPSNSPDLNPVDYSIWGILQERVYRLQIHDVKELKEHLLSECICLNACVCVNGGHFEHKFLASHFLLCFVCFVDTGSPKSDRYKHVQSVNIVWNVLLLCLTLSHSIVAT